MVYHRVGRDRIPVRLPDSQLLPWFPWYIMVFYHGLPWFTCLKKHAIYHGIRWYIFIRVLGVSIQKQIVLDTLRQDGQGCRKGAWPAEKRFTLLEPKPAGCGLQEHDEVQDGICSICLIAAFETALGGLDVIQRRVVNISRARGFSGQECHLASNTDRVGFLPVRNRGERYFCREEIVSARNENNREYMPLVGKCDHFKRVCSIKLL